MHVLLSLVICLFFFEANAQIVKVGTGGIKSHHSFPSIIDAGREIVAEVNANLKSCGNSHAPYSDFTELTSDLQMHQKIYDNLAADKRTCGPGEDPTLAPLVRCHANPKVRRKIERFLLVDEAIFRDYLKATGHSNRDIKRVLKFYRKIVPKQAE